MQTKGSISYILLTESFRNSGTMYDQNICLELSAFVDFCARSNVAE